MSHSNSNGLDFLSTASQVLAGKGATLSRKQAEEWNDEIEHLKIMITPVEGQTFKAPIRRKRKAETDISPNKRLEKDDIRQSNNKFADWLKRFQPSDFNRASFLLPNAISENRLKSMIQLRKYADDHLKGLAKAVICHQDTESHMDAHLGVMFLSSEMANNPPMARQWIDQHVQNGFTEPCEYNDGCKKEIAGVWFTCPSMCTAFRVERFTPSSCDGACPHCGSKMVPLEVIMEIARALGGEYWWRK